MIGSYLKVAARNLWKRKLYTAINVTGLATGVACFILLSLYLQNEWTYDRFFQHADQLYRIRVDYGEKDQPLVHTAMTPSALAPVLKDYPEVKYVARAYVRSSAVRYGNTAIKEERFLYADPAFFQLFSFHLREGNAATVLSGPNMLVMTASAAKKYFGAENPVGKTVRVNSQDMLVTGITDDAPSNTHLKYEFVASWASLGKKDNWDAPNYYTYVQLNDNTTPSALHARIGDYVKNVLMPQMGGSKGATLDMTPEPVTGIHLHSIAGNSTEAGGDIRYNYILMIIAVMLLLIACINFMNLATARSTERSREIGVRKAVGAHRGQIFWQFMAESTMITFAAILLGWVLSLYLLPLFNHLADTRLHFGGTKGYRIYALLGIVFVGTAFLTGTYPAMFLSAFKPVQVLKGKLSAASGGAVRKTLVVFQFAASVFFIICTIVVGKQLYYIQHKNIGMDRSQVLVLDGSKMNSDRLRTFKERLLQTPGVQHVSASYDSPVKTEGGYTLGKIETKPADYAMNVAAVPVEKDYLKTMDIRLVAGEDLTEADIRDVLQEDDKKVYHFFLNETAVKKLGWTPNDAIGKRVSLNGRNGMIKGVMKDFHFASMKRGIDPIVVFPEYYWFGKVLVKTASSNWQRTIADVEQVWNGALPAEPFAYHFLDQEFDDIYKREYRTSHILTTFSLVIIVISCLGLLGLAAFTAQQRTKEIGIRKVMGASVGSVVMLLSKDFLRLVLIALCVASPLAWLAMNRWLGDFAYHTSLSAWIFLAGGMIAIVIAFLTVSVQSLKAARINPVISLRSE
ncbi:ABC transporter permease [Chitinophaga vietnamensis]|uniref:ABC transporter permease n=1 Tax=Chitinophaga vietnamensis TaxID=2593957 RepID=UPI0011787153|nr:ABC transporter permease [Chitinophaga vietnamensis]